MAEKKLSRSSYDDYIETINKITPQLKTLLAHISSEQAQAAPVGGARARSSPRSGTRCYTSTGRPRSCATGARRRAYTAAQPEQVQAVTNCGKIVYGTMRDGKMEVQGTVGEVSHDLLGLESVNAGRRTRTRSSSPRPRTPRSGTRRSTGTRSSGARSRGSPRRRATGDSPSMPDYGMD
ncbi:TPA_asm: MC115L [Molluscum contagiosum virus]|nr:TPA_asm: MC115L [Molluscum contagiosum virus]DBA42569.1 TPA_asm: MC115L [Molluscum contagiosum virus]